MHTLQNGLYCCQFEEKGQSCVVVRSRLFLVVNHFVNFFLSLCMFVIFMISPSLTQNHAYEAESVDRTDYTTAMINQTHKKQRYSQIIFVFSCFIHIFRHKFSSMGNSLSNEPTYSSVMANQINLLIISTHTHKRNFVFLLHG